ncbi:MAG: MFS transporter, partial [Bryobacteraceae bacterium]
VTWYVLSETHSTLSVSWLVILVTLPGLFVPWLGGVLIDRVDRRWLGITLDAARAVVVLGVAEIAHLGLIRIWHVYAMTVLLGIGFAVYWSTANSLVQEIIPREWLVNANSAVMVAVQGGMTTAGALVGFIYARAGLAGVLGIDGTTYVVSAVCLLLLRRGYHPPQRHHDAIESAGGRASGEIPLELSEPGVLPFLEGSLAAGVVRDMKEGLRYLRENHRVFALGFTLACMMAGVLSSTVVIVALAQDILHAGARGYGYIEAGWALGAFAGGFSAQAISRGKPVRVMIAALSILAVGQALFPYARWLILAAAMNVVFGACRALAGVLTQSSLMAIVPQRLMGRTQSAFAIMATFLQVTMSFALGWLAENAGLPVAFLVLALIYGLAVLAAVRVRFLTPAAQL